MTINIEPEHAKSMTCLYNWRVFSQPGAGVFQSAIREPESVLRVTNMVLQAFCKHGLRAQALCGSIHGNDTLTKQNTACSGR